nr:hypothetical protein [Conyzicola lurida]
MRVDTAAPDAVGVAAHVRPVARRGAFHCSDHRLNRVWSTSAYTLRLCMQGLVVDGIKRDRMPWAGDQALAVLANAYAFADAPIQRDGLVALGRARDGYVNGIADYSLWWVIAQRDYLEHFGDLEHAAREADHLQAFMEDLAEDVGRDGVFRPRQRAGSFVDAGPGSVFIDWGVTLEEGRDPVALQMLWYRALRSAEHVLAAVGHAGATGWARTADTAAATLHDRGWHARDGVWREYLDDDDDGAVGQRGYANLLAVLAGLVPADGARTVAAEIAAGTPGTPFMRSFALLARAELGDADGVVADIADRWGRMLDAGAQTFWEEFDDGDTPLAMYGRPFGKSLCHGWAAGPAALLPRVVLGVRPLSDGWREFGVSPRLGALDWASAVVPVPGGEIFVTADRDRVRVDVPAGHTLVRGDERTTGPATVEFSAPSTAAPRAAG